MKRIFMSIMLIVLTSSFVVGQSRHSVDRKTGIVQANGISLAYESFGSADREAILLIHGTGAQMILWPEELCETLASKGYRVIRFDHRDVGLSSRLEALGMPDWASIIPLIGSCDESKLPYTLTDMSMDALGLLDALDISKAHIVGASMGGAIAQLIAIHHPERTLSLTSIMASSGNPNAVKGDPEVLKTMGTPPPLTNEKEELIRYLSKIYKAIGSPGYPAGEQTLRHLAEQSVKRSWYPVGSARQAAAVIIGDNCDRRNLLMTIKVPTVVLHGEADPVVNIAAGKEVADAVPNATFISIPGLGHDLPVPVIPRIADAILIATRSAHTK